MEFDRVPSITKYLSVIFLFVWLGRSTVWNFLPIYFEQHISSVFLIGVMTSLPAIVPILTDIPVGNLVQRSGERVVLFLGLMMSILSPLVYITALPALLVFGKLFEGLSKGLIWNASWSLNMKSADDEIESESISVFFLGMNLAMVVGPIIGGYIIASRGFQLPFMLWMFTAGLGVLLYYVYVGIKTKMSFTESLAALERRSTYADDWEHLKDNWDNLRQPFTLVFLYSIIFSFYWLAVPLLLERMGAGYALMGVIFGLSLVPKLFQFVFGVFADRVGKLRAVTILSGVLVFFLFALSRVESIFLIGGLFFVARALSGGLSPAIHAFYDSRVPDDLQGELTGFFELAKHTGQAVGPIIAGAVADVYGVSSSFAMAAAVAGVIAVFSYRISD